MADVYKTKDWTEVLWLLVNEVPLVGADRMGERCVRYHFGNPEDCLKHLKILNMSGDNDLKVFEKTLSAIRKARSVMRKTP